MPSELADIRAPEKWAAIERDYRAGLKTIDAISREYKVGKATLYAKARENGWKRDLSAKIKDRVAEKVARHEARQQMIAADEEGLVEAAANKAAEIELAHRVDLGRARAVTMRMLAELEIAGAHLPMLIDIVTRLVAEAQAEGKEVTITAEDLKPLATLAKLGARASTLSHLAKSLSLVVEAERKAYGLGDDDKDKGAVAFTLVQNFG